MSKSKTTTALFLSALINMFLLGVVFSSHTMRPDTPHRPPPPHKQGAFPQFEHAKNTLSLESKKIVEKIIAHHSDIMRNDTHALQRHMQEAQDLLLSSTLDKAALENTHKNMDTHNVKIKVSLSNMIYKIATELPDEERIEFFKRALPQHPHGKPPPPRGRPPHP